MKRIEFFMRKWVNQDWKTNPHGTTRPRKVAPVERTDLTSAVSWVSVANCMG